MVSTEEILKKYSKKIESQISSTSIPAEGFSKEYEKFKGEMVPEISGYEKWAKSLGNLIKIRAGKKEFSSIQKQIQIAHLDITPENAITLSLISFILGILATGLLTLALYFMGINISFLFIILGFFASAFLYYYARTMPRRLANAWRLQASSQMVPAVLYVVVYMKHTSNLERAIAFAAEHLEGPLALDFKKIFYDVEIGRFSTIKQSLDSYLESWRDYAPEFIESFHLIESSLYEPIEARRIATLEKALQSILDGIYEKMLSYTREIRAPMTNIYMLGIILPTLALAMLPLATALLQGMIKWHHLILLFNIIIPFGVFYLVSETLLKRPGGYGESSILELSPDYPKFKSKKPWLIAALISLPFLFFGLLPYIMQIPFLQTLGFQSDYSLQNLGFNLGNIKLFDFRILTGVKRGPFSFISTILSLLIPLSIALFFAISYRLKTKQAIKSRNSTKSLENEFTTSLFQLGNRLADGVPAEIAFAKVADSTQGQTTQQFFLTVNQNIQQLGMPVESAIFDKKRGAITFFPSALIATSMKILVESVKKGLKIAAQSLMSISEYVKNIDKINQRLHDLLAEIVSDMRSNMTFLAPMLAGIVTGLGSMITSILLKLQDMQAFASGSEIAGTFGSLSNILSIFDVSQIVPPYQLQIIIGIYILEIIFILSTALVTIDSGKDPLKEKHELSKNLISGMSLYFVSSLISIVALSVLVTIALSSLS